MLILLTIVICFPLLLSANIRERQRKVFYTAEITGNDTILRGYLPDVIVFGPLKFKNEKERIAYSKLVRDVKRTLPYAKDVANNIIESYEIMMTLETEKERQKFLEEVQKFIMDKYKPQMKKLTKNQGKILVKLIDRECNVSSYDIVKSLVGGLKAGFYNTFAKLFGNNLKTRYDPEGEDKMIERIATLIEQGSI
ncbi:DUF4294 domain-containing protein [Dysgonomonas sp. 216]|nr:DUF4294 domain-containing protein [Dysgonomonas sp. 216]